MKQPVQIHGTVHPRFGDVAEAFRANFTLRDEIGASLCIFFEGEKVVDVWAGTADRATNRAWAEDTGAVTFSVTKGLVATAFLMLEDRGLLDLESFVAQHWPEFSVHGKERITVRTLLNHRAGLSLVSEPIPLAHFATPERVDPVLARQRPVWPPGTAQGYGATAWGMYAGALFRRVAGESVGTFLRREVFDRLGTKLRLGTGPGDHPDIATTYPADIGAVLKRALPRIALQDTLEGRFFGKALLQPGSIPARALKNPVIGPRRLEVVNDPEVRAMELPWKNAIGSGRDVATVYAALAHGGSWAGRRLVSPEAIARVTRRQSWSYQDEVLCKPLGFSQGFIKDEPHLFSPNEAAFGHPGAGGALGLADPTHQLSVGYVQNGMHWHVRSPRALAICRATYKVLGYG